MLCLHSSIHPSYALTTPLCVCVRARVQYLGDIGQVDQLCLAGKARNRLVLADASPNLKLFPLPYGSVGDQPGWRCQLVVSGDGHSDVITDLAVSRCGQYLASGSKDQSVCLWHLVEHPDPSAVASVQLVDRRVDAHGAHISAVCFDQ